MNRSVVLLMGTALVLGGCSKNIGGGAPVVPMVSPPIKITAPEVLPTNEQLLTAKLINAMLSSKQLQAATFGTQNTLFVESVRNRTSNYIETDLLNEIINFRLSTSDAFRSVEKERLESVRKELNLQEDYDLVNPATSIQFGKMIGAQYMLTTHLEQHQNANELASYKMTMRLMSLDSGIIEWSNEAELPQK